MCPLLQRPSKRSICTLLSTCRGMHVDRTLVHQKDGGTVSPCCQCVNLTKSAQKTQPPSQPLVLRGEIGTSVPACPSGSPALATAF
jgi:hypothetical protein